MENNSETFELLEAQRMVRDYVCSTCWDGLYYAPGPERRYYVRCVTCRHDTVGFVTKHYANNCRLKSRGEAAEVKEMLKEAGVINNPHKGKTIEEINKELGF